MGSKVSHPDQNEEAEANKIIEKYYNPSTNSLQLTRSFGFNMKIANNILEIVLTSLPKQTQIINLANINMSPHVLESLSKKEIYVNLTQLNLSKNKIGSQGIKWLTKINLKNLDLLYLYSCSIGGQGSKHLVKVNWPNLSILHFFKNDISIDGSLMYQHHNWLKLQKLFTYEFDLICFWGYYLLSAQKVQINQFFYRGESEAFKSISNQCLGNGKFIQLTHYS